MIQFCNPRSLPAAENLSFYAAKLELLCQVFCKSLSRLWCFDFDSFIFNHIALQEWRKWNRKACEIGHNGFALHSQMAIISGEHCEESCSAMAGTSVPKEESDNTYSVSNSAANSVDNPIDIIKPHAIHQTDIPTSSATDVRGNLADPGHVSLDLGPCDQSSNCKVTLLAKDGLLRGPDRQYSFRDNVGHAATETYVVTKLCFRLLRYLGIGYQWITKFAALGLYAFFLMPGFIQVGWCYFLDKRIHRNIVYGENRRHRLDLYLPDNLETPKPVVAFVTGGAWTIGNKAWGSLLGLQLVEKDVIVACIDYRNFPRGTISNMVEDVCQGVSFICNHIASYGGDPDRLYLAGQSAGAHIAACALAEQARKESERGKTGKESEESEQDEDGLTWKASQFKAYFGISGGYNLYKLIDHFHRRGLYRNLFLRIMEGEESFNRYSPELFLQSLSCTSVGSLLPPIFLFHGTADYSIPSEASISFAEILTSIGAQATVRLYEGKTHTDLFIQDPMRGGYDALLADILAIVRVGDVEAQAKDASATARRRMVPECLLQLARRVSPF